MRREANPWDSGVALRSSIAGADFRQPDIVYLIGQHTEADILAITLSGKHIDLWRKRVFQNNAFVLLSQAKLLKNNQIGLTEFTKATVIPLAIWADPALGVGYEL